MKDADNAKRKRTDVDDADDEKKKKSKKKNRTENDESKPTVTLTKQDIKTIAAMHTSSLDTSKTDQQSVGKWQTLEMEIRNLFLRVGEEGGKVLPLSKIAQQLSSKTESMSKEDKLNFKDLLKRIGKTEKDATGVAVLRLY